MSLADIVKTLGGDLYGRHRAAVPGPGHGPEDRSISLFVDRSGRLVVTSFGRTPWHEVVDDLRARGLIDADKRLTGRGAMADWRRPAALDLSRAEKMRRAQAIWASGQAIFGTAAERHLRGRGIVRDLPGPEALRHTLEAPLRAYDPGASRTQSALLAGVSDPDGLLCAVEITFLDRAGGRDARLRLGRKTVGAVPPGSAVRLDPAEPAMLVGEGVATTLSASERFALPGWALLSAVRLVTWSPPAGVGEVLVAGDNGRAGTLAAHRLVARLRQGGVRARAVFPDACFDDFNAEAGALRAKGEGRAGQGGRRAG